MSSRVQAVTSLRVRSALDLNEFMLFYQPKVNLCSGAVIGFEALLRWQHPQDGYDITLGFFTQCRKYGAYR